MYSENYVETMTANNAADTAAEAAAVAEAAGVAVPENGGGDDNPPVSSEITNVLNEVLKTLVELRRDHGREKEPEPLVSRRGMENVPIFEGKHEQWENFSNRLTAFLGEDTGWVKMLRWAANLDVPITEDILIDYGERLGVRALKMSKQLGAFFVYKTAGHAQTINSNAEGNGVRAYQRVAQLYGRILPQSRRKLLEKIIQPPPVQNFEGIIAAQEVWAKNLKKYHEQTKDALLTDVLMVGYLAILTAALVKDIYALERELTTLQEVKDYVERQIDVRRPETQTLLELNVVNGDKDGAEPEQSS